MTHPSILQHTTYRRLQLAMTVKRTGNIFNWDNKAKLVFLFAIKYLIKTLIRTNYTHAGNSRFYSHMLFKNTQYLCNCRLWPIIYHSPGKSGQFARYYNFQPIVLLQARSIDWLKGIVYNKYASASLSEIEHNTNTGDCSLPVFGER